MISLPVIGTSICKKVMPESDWCVPFDLDDFDEKLNDEERSYELDDVKWYTYEIYDEEGVMLAGDL